MEYDLNREEMLDLLSDIVQSSDVYGNQEQDLLNFIEEIRESTLIAKSSAFGALSPLLEKGKKEEKK